ncbi:hypothetical protein LMG33818_001450 [Halomonadaceae bacterium LMG 33818]|uniref:AzlD domain-containing protein n=1 Tax=Cernens ardua TaxID=3402176 RepID=UPI003EDB84C5
MFTHSALPAIILMGLITYSFRLLPFLMRRPTNELFGPRINRALNALGPSLLVSIAMMVIIPDITDKYHASIGALVLLCIALVLVIVVHRIVKSVGLSIIAAMVIYGIFLYSGWFDF